MAGSTRLELATSGVTGENVRSHGFGISEFSVAFSRDRPPRSAWGRRSPTQFRGLKWHTYRHTCRGAAALLPAGDKCPNFRRAARGQGRSPEGPSEARRLDLGEHRKIIANRRRPRDTHEAHGKTRVHIAHFLSLRSAQPKDVPQLFIDTPVRLAQLAPTRPLPPLGQRLIPSGLKPMNCEALYSLSRVRPLPKGPFNTHWSPIADTPVTSQRLHGSMPDARHHSFRRAPHRLRACCGHLPAAAAGHESCRRFASFAIVGAPAGA
jgi:hypothetical protein